MPQPRVRRGMANQTQPLLEVKQMKQETGRSKPPTGLVEHPLLLGLGAAAIAAVCSAYAVFAILL